MGLYKCRPSKWAWGIIPLALPFLGAWFLNSPQMVGKLSKTATASVKAADLEDVQAQMDGRDVVLIGQASSRESVEQLVTTLLGAYGVRRVDVSGVKIVKPVTLEKPTVKSSIGNNAKPEISGTWPQAKATTLQVTVAGKPYILGTDSELVTDKKGNWHLKPSTLIADGVHDVVVAVTDGKKAAASDDSKAEVTIDTTAPRAPTIVTKLLTKDRSPKLAGTFEAANGASLIVSLAGKDYVLGKDKELTADKAGNWSLVPTLKLADGTYDIKAKSADKVGNESTGLAKQALTIDTAAPAAGTTSVVQGKQTKPTIKGKWPHGDGNGLAVLLAGKTYILGESKELTSDKAGNWSLTPSTELKEGKHSLTITTSDSLGNKRDMVAPNAIIVDKTAPKAPAITTTLNPNTAPVISGTWAENLGNSLRVVVSGKVFVLGRDKQLTSDSNGNWKLTLAQPLGDGKHSILAESSDQFGNVARTKKPVVLVVDTTKPDDASINAIGSHNGLGTVTGTWPEADGNRLAVSVADQRFKLGTDKQLASDGKGNWVLKLTSAFKEGIHSVVATVTDKAGNSSRTESKSGFVVDLTPPPAPAITTVLSRQRTPLITGTWNAEQSTTLKVKIADQMFSSLNKGEIIINGDHWSVQPAKPIKDGTYDIEATVTDKVGNTAKDVGRGELVIDATSPSAPTVRPIFGTSSKPTIVGTWPQDGENSLSVKLDGMSYSLGSGENLKSDGKGNWSLTPKNELAAGSYDVKVTVADKMGNISNDISKGEVSIKVLKKPEPPNVVQTPNAVQAPKLQLKKSEKEAPTLPEKAAMNCQKEFSTVLAGQNILFNTNKVTISAQSKPLMVKLAKVANACPAAKIEISGHTDSRGSAVYNQSLSEGRASAVLDALVRLGINRNRVRAVGYGETKPIADNNITQGQARNRRIEFNVDQ